MSWMEDRDLLLAETQMLISELAGAKPSMATRTPPPVAAIYQSEPAQDPSPSEPLLFERIVPLPTVNQRQEIANRLAAFRATQARFQREREAYSVAILNKARAGTPR
jgi:histone deacetylase complex regulatory component SIN3